VRRSTENNPFVTRLDHDHREGENIRFLAKRPILPQDLWRGPSCGIAMAFRGALYGVQVLGDRGETEIRDSRMASGIHEDVWLDTCQNGGKTGLLSITYSLEVTMDYIAGMEIVKAASDIGYLVVGVSMRRSTTGRTPTRPRRSAFGFPLT